MHLLPRFVLNRVRIVFQALVVQGKALIFLLHVENLSVKLFRLVLFLLVGHQTVMAKDSVKPQQYGKPKQYASRRFATHPQRPGRNPLRPCPIWLAGFLLVMIGYQRTLRLSLHPHPRTRCRSF